MIDVALGYFRKSPIPVVLFALDIVIFAIEPKYWFPDRFAPLGLELGTWRNLLIVALALPYLLQRGIRSYFNPVLFGYLLVLASSIWLATPLAGLSLVQNLKTFAALILGPVVLYEIRYSPQQARRWLALISLLPAINLLAGAGLQLAGLTNLVKWEDWTTGAWRLAGSSAAGPFGLVCYCAILAALVLTWSNIRFRWVVALDVLLVVLSGTRDATAATVVMLGVFAFEAQRAKGRPRAWNMVFPAVLALVVGLLIYAPNIPLRFEPTSREKAITAGVTANNSSASGPATLPPPINTSGRFATWIVYWRLARVNPWFGRGLGAGTLADLVDADVLRVPHNEYLRFLIEGGLWGTAILLLAFTLQFLLIIKRTPAEHRLFFLSVVGLFAAMALIENVVGGQAAPLVFWTFLGCIRETFWFGSAAEAQAARAPTGPERVNICGAAVDKLTLDSAVDGILRHASTPNVVPAYVVTPNAHHIVLLQDDPEFRQIYQGARWILPDGVSLLWAAQFLDTPLLGRVNGTDLLEELCRLAVPRGLRVFLLGGRPGTAQKARAALELRFPGIDIVGAYSPPFGFEKDTEEQQRVVDMVARAAPQILFVGFGAPKQEKWMAAHYRTLGIPASLGIGSSLEIVGGIVPRAPLWMRKNGLEWLFRVIREPRRLTRRYLIGNPYFVFLVLRQKYFAGEPARER